MNQEMRTGLCSNEILELLILREQLQKLVSRAHWHERSTYLLLSTIIARNIGTKLLDYLVLFSFFFFTKQRCSAVNLCNFISCKVLHDILCVCTIPT